MEYFIFVVGTFVGWLVTTAIHAWLKYQEEKKNPFIFDRIYARMMQALKKMRSSADYAYQKEARK